MCTKNFLNSLLLLIALASIHLYGMDHGSSGQDPLMRMNYRLAFDQKKIHEKFKNLMEHWGCSENVFEAPADSQEEATDHTLYQQEEDYKKACLDTLQGTYRWAITEDAREALSMMGLLSLAATTLNLTLSSKSVGGQFGIFAIVMDTAYLLRPIIKAAYNLKVPPANPLANLEKQYALTQCFIPKELWPVITEKFMLARTNQFQQRTCMEFLEFALGLTLYKPKVKLKPENIMEGMNQLFKKIDHFFEQYDEQSPSNVWTLKNNISKFICSLFDPQNEAPRYLYLHGAGGIGKTYFVNQLCQWIEEIIPHSVKFENLVIATPGELEGDSNRPGSILCILRNQLMENRNGSVVFMDEATWINSYEMSGIVKRVFNGDQSKLSTSYFGGGIDGSGINLTIPPMLIFVASNEEIKNPALKTRFDSINFPLPKKERLLQYAKEIAAQNMLISSDMRNRFNFTQWLEESQINNFRDIASQIVPAILSNH